MVEEAGLDAEGMADTTSQLQVKIKALTDGKVDVMFDENNFKNTTEILREMSQVWEDMTDKEQAAALELLGGKRQANVLSAIIQNFDIVEDAIEASANSEGSALKENEKVLDSIQGRLNQFNNAVETFWNNLLDSDVIKFFVDLGTEIVKLASDFGEVRSVVFGLLMYFNMSKKYPFDLASMIFGPKGLPHILSGFKKIKKAAAETNPLALYSPGLPEAKQAPQLTSGKMDMVPINQELQNTTKTNFFTDTIKDAQTATQSIWQLFMNMLNKLRAATSNIFTSAFTSIKSKASKLANSIKAQYYKATNQAFMTDENGRVTKASVQDTRIDVYGGGDSANKEASKFSTVWDNHITRLRDSINKVKQDFTTIWQHHNERVNESVKYASMQFNKLKDSATNIFSKISNISSNVANGMKDIYGKASDSIKSKISSIKNAFTNATSRSNKVETNTGGQQSYSDVKSAASKVSAEVSRIWQQHIANLRGSFVAVKNDISTIWEHHKIRVKESTEYAQGKISTFANNASANFATLKNNISTHLGRIPQVAQSVADRTKQAFSKISSPIINVFNGITDKLKQLLSKIKNMSKDTSKAFKEGLGYTDSVQTGSSMFDSSSKIQNKQITMGNEQAVANQLDIINQKAKEGQGALQEYMSTTTDVDDVTKAYVETLDGQEATMGGLNKFIKAHNSEVKASGIAAKAAAVGHQLLNAAISMGISLLISAAIEAITKYVNKSKELAEATEELMDTYNSAQSTLRSHSETINEIKDDYARLAKGVDGFGNNISLSTDEFARYNEITNKIADMFPNMVTGFTEEGNAIIGLKGNVEALTKAYEEEAEAARSKVITGAQDTLENFRNNTTKENFFTEKSKKDELAFFENIIKNGASDITELMKSGSMNVDNWLENAGINDTNWFSSSNNFKNAIEENMAQIQAYYQTLKSELDAEVQPIKTTMFAFLENDEDYNNLSDKGKQMAQSIINGFGTEFYASDEMKDKSWAEIAAWMDTNVIQKLQDTDNMEQFDTTFNLQTKFNNGDVPVDEYLKQIDALATFLESQGFDKEVITSIKVMFDYDNLNTKMNSAKDLLDNEGDKQVGTLTDSDLEIIDKNKTNWQKEMEVDGKTTLSWEELKNKIEDAKNAAWSASEDFKKVSEEIDNIQSAYSTLSDVVTQYNKDGYLTLDNLQALLSLEPEYLSCLQMENGQLSLNQSALEALIQAKLDAAKATAVQDAITQLNALANKTEADAIAESANTANSAIGVLGEYASSLGIVAQNAIGAAGAVGAFQAAVRGAKENKFVSQEDIDKVLSDFNMKINFIDSVSKNLNSNFKNIVSPDSSSKNEESALEKLQKKYEHQLSNLENQKTYIQNEIDRLEAEDEGVSKSYYEKQIAIEQQKMNVYKQERAALTNLLNSTKKGTDEWYETANAIWETEHGIQSCATEMANLRKEIVELYQTVFDKMESAFGNMENLFSDRQSYIEKYMELLELQDEAKPASAYTDLIAQEEKKLANYEQELKNLIRIRDNAVASGYLKEGSDEWIEMTDAIREQEAAVLDSKVAIAQYNDELKQLHVEAFEMVRDAFDARGDFYTAQQDYIEGYIDQLDAMNVDVPEEVYRDLIDIEKKKQENLQANILDARQGLTDLEAAGYTAADEEWQNANNRIIEYEAQQQESITKTIEWNNAIRELDFTKFDRFIEKLQDLNSELDNVYKLTSRKDVANEDGTWTEDGLTSLATMYQQYELSKGQAKAYGEEIDRLTEAYARGEMSENTYNERLKELTDGQWDAIQTSEDLKDSIIDMCEVRVDLIEDGIQKEIEAYQELIELKKEELSAERDLYDFKKDVEKQTKNIAELERKIASLSGADDAASIAERRKLEKD